MEGEHLTPRELVVMHELMKDGAQNRIIADNIGIAEQTVKFHLTSIFAKAGLVNSNRAALVLWWIRVGQYKQIEKQQE